MRVSVVWFRRGCTGLLLGCAIMSLCVGCCTTNNSTKSGGAASSKVGSGGFFGAEPKKVQTTSDFIGQPRSTY